MTIVDRLNGVSEGLGMKAPCRVATTANITLSGFQTIDDITLASGDSNLRVAVWKQITASENGIYDAASGAWTRAKDFDGNRDVVCGTSFRVTSGNAYGNKRFSLRTADPITIGTTSLTFAVDVDDDHLAISSQPDAAGDGTTDDSTALNAMMTAARATGDSTTQTYIANMELGNLRYRANSSIDMTNFRAKYGIGLRNGVILSHATGKIALDLAGSRRAHLQDLVLNGDGTNSPSVGIFLGRYGSSAPSASEHLFTHLTVQGTFTIAGIVNYASETSHYRGIYVANDKRDTAAYAVIFEGLDNHPVTSDYQTIATGSQSAIMCTTDNIAANRFNAVGSTITGITKANPAVVTYTGTDPDANGSLVCFSGVLGMTEVNDVVYTIASLNTTTKTFALSGIDSSAYSAYTSGGTIFYKTGPAYYFCNISAQHHRNMYAITYGSYGFVFQRDTAADDLLALHIQGHTEGVAIQALGYFMADTGTLKLVDFEFSEHRSHANVNCIATDASGAGSVIFENSKISVERFQNALTGGFFSAPQFFAFTGNSELLIGKGTYLGADEIGKLLRQPDTVIVSDQTYPVRKYNMQPSAAHNQILDNCNGLFASVTSAAASAYNNGWLDRVGSSAGPTISQSGATPSGIAFAPSGGTTYANYGTHRRGPQIFKPTSGEMLFEFSTNIATNITSQNRAIGWDGVPTSGTLGATDSLCVLSSTAVPTVNVSDACGIVYDATNTATTNWYAFSRKASGTAAAVALGVSPVAGTTEYWRLFVSTAGDMYVFRSTDNYTWSLLTTVTGAVTASMDYAPTISGALTAGTATRTMTVYGLDAKTLKS